MERRYAKSIRRLDKQETRLRKSYRKPLLQQPRGLGGEVAQSILTAFAATDGQDAGREVDVLQAQL